MPEVSGVTAAENKWIVVTGANRGLGYELCRILVQNKHPVIVACRTQEKADEAVARLRQATGHDVTVQPLKLDPSDPASIEAGVAHLRELRDGKVGVLVSNAGTNDTFWDLDCWNKIMAVNFTGAISLAEQILPVLADGGRIVNVTSELGALSGLPSAAYRHQIEDAETLDALRAIKFMPDDAGCLAAVEKGYKGIGLPVYRISKAMMNRATKLLSEDERLTSRSITISAVCPSWCRTDLGDPSINANAPSSAEKGAGSIAWNVEHKQPGEINGRVWQFGKELGF